MKGPQEMGPGDCLPKTQLYAKAQAEVYGVRPGQCWKVKVRGYPPVRGEKLRAEAPVNAGRNYNGPKVAKFLAG